VFVASKYFQPRLIFVCKVRNMQNVESNDASLRRVHTSFTNIRLGLKYLTRINTLAYIKREATVEREMFYWFAISLPKIYNVLLRWAYPGVTVIKLFFLSLTIRQK
jgi:hypothetical protein